MKKFVGMTKEPVHGHLIAYVYRGDDGHLWAMMPNCWSSDQWSLSGSGTCWCLNHSPSIAQKIDADDVEFFDEKMSWKINPHYLADLIGLETQGDRWDALVSACAAYREFTPIFELGELANVDEYDAWQLDFLAELESVIGERGDW